MNKNMSDGLASNQYDLVIKNGYILDPKSGLAETMNLGIKGGKITCLTKNNIIGFKVIDAKGKIVAPGFIDFYSHIDGKFHAAKCMVRQGATTTIGGYREFNGSIVKEIANEGFLINHGFCISQSFTLRTAAGIWNPYRPATKQEIITMCNLAESFLENGAYGIHFGLEYFPGTSSEEIISLANVAKMFQRPLLFHMRKCGIKAWQYLNEIFEYIELTGVSAHFLILFYHFGFGDGLDIALKMIDEQRAKGFDITADSGVYSAWIDRICSRGFDPGWQEDWGADFKDLLISSGLYAGQYCNKEIFDYLRDELPNTMVTAFACNISDIYKPLQKPYVFVSTNAADGSHYPGIGHPEVAGTFPKLLGRYVREKKILNLIEAIRKITYLPAQRFGIQNKGWLGIGADADIVIFDFDTIIDNANYLGSGEPDAAPSGIEYVIVNGEIIVEKNYVYENKRAGKLLTRV